MPSHAAFLEEILVHPEDDVPRLVYADWLDEQGDLLGEFIRVQCLLAKVAIDDDRRWSLQTREELLRREFGGIWAEPIRPFALDWKFRRGFVERITLPAETFLEHATEIFQAAPIQGVRLIDPEHQLSALANSPWLERLRSLDLSHSNVFWNQFEDLAYSPDLVYLKELNLRGTPLCSDQGLSLLIQCDYLRNLTALDLSERVGDPIRPNTIEDMSASRTFKKLTSLNLAGHGTGAGPLIRALAENTLLWNLENLDLSQNGGLPDGGALKALFRSPQTSNLRRLLLGKNFLASSVRTFANSKSLRNLQVFATGEVFLGDEPHLKSIKELAASRVLNNLVQLSLANCMSTSDAIHVLFESDQFLALRELNLSGTRFGDVELDFLPKSSFLVALRSLNLRGAEGDFFDEVAISRRGVNGLLTSETSLQVLDLGHQPISDINPLADSSMAQHLCDLGLSKTNLDDSAIPRLCDAGAFPNLELVDLSGVKLNRESRENLQKRFGAGVKLGRGK